MVSGGVGVWVGVASMLKSFSRLAPGLVNIKDVIIKDAGTPVLNYARP